MHLCAPTDARRRSPFLEAEDCTPEINTSEIIVHFQWYVPMDCQWHFPTEFHLPGVFSKGLSLVHVPMELLFV